MVVPEEPWFPLPRAFPCPCLCLPSGWAACPFQFADQCDDFHPLCQSENHLDTRHDRVLSSHAEATSDVGTSPSFLVHDVGSCPGLDNSSSRLDVLEEHNLCPGTLANVSGTGCIHSQMLWKSSCNTCTSRVRSFPWLHERCNWSKLRPWNDGYWVDVELKSDATGSIWPCPSCGETKKVLPLLRVSAVNVWLRPWWWKVHTNSQSRLNGMRCKTHKEAPRNETQIANCNRQLKAESCGPVRRSGKIIDKQGYCKPFQPRIVSKQEPGRNRELTPRAIQNKRWCKATNRSRRDEIPMKPAAQSMARGWAYR